MPEEEQDSEAVSGLHNRQAVPEADSKIKTAVWKKP
jgi:hypothetical protein